MLLTLSGLPALLAAPLAYVSMKESSLWIVDASRGGGQSISYRELFSPPLLNHSVLGTIAVFIGSFGAWSLNPWIPAYLGELGIAPDSVPLLTLWIMVGALAGYALYGFISDRLGRNFTFQIFSSVWLWVLLFRFFAFPDLVCGEGENLLFQPFFSEPRPRSFSATSPDMDLFSLRSSPPE